MNDQPARAFRDEVTQKEDSAAQDRSDSKGQPPCDSRVKPMAADAAEEQNGAARAEGVPSQ